MTDPAKDRLVELGRAQEQALRALEPALPPGTMALVVVGNRLWMQQNTLYPAPLPLLHLAQSLIEQAADLLPEGSPLREQAEYAAGQLPDRFEDQDAS